MNGPETQAHADELRSEQMMAASEMRAALLAKPFSRLLYSGGIAIRDAVLRVVWHLGDVILRLDGIHEQAADGVAGLETGLSKLDATVERLDDMRSLLADLHADLAALLPAAPLAPAAGTIIFTGVVLGATYQLVPAGGHVDRIVFYNTAGAAVEFEVRLGATRIDHVRLTPNSSYTVGPFKATAAVMVSGVAGTVANFALTRWSVVYR